MTKRCDACGQTLKEGDPITFIGEAIYHEIPSAGIFAINEISDCYSVQHKWCSGLNQETYA